MAVFSSISDTGYDTVITTLGQQDLRNAVCCGYEFIDFEDFIRIVNFDDFVISYL